MRNLLEKLFIWCEKPVFGKKDTNNVSEFLTFQQLISIETRGQVNSFPSPRPMLLSCCALLSYACFKRAISHGRIHFKCTFIALKWICEVRLYFFVYHCELNRKKHQLTQYLILAGCEMMLNWWMNESQSYVCFWIVFMEIIHYHVYVYTETSFLCFHFSSMR